MRNPDGTPSKLATNVEMELTFMETPTITKRS
jgi:hypothetical protein